MASSTIFATPRVTSRSGAALSVDASANGTGVVELKTDQAPVDATLDAPVSTIAADSAAAVSDAVTDVATAATGVQPSSPTPGSPPPAQAPIRPSEITTGAPTITVQPPATPNGKDAGTPGTATATPNPASPPPKEVLKEAATSLKDGAQHTVAATVQIAKDLANKRVINVTLDQIVQALFFMFLAFQLLLIKLIKPSPWWLMVYTLYGTGLGLGMSYLFYANKKRKAEACDVLGTTVGLKGLQHLVGQLPSWLSYTEREKINWLNKLLEEVWPFYDKGVCKMVKKMTEDIFAQTLTSMKVPGLKSIGFKHLTFGDAPFRVETIHVSDKHTDAMVMELDVRWCGEANITLAIELSAGEFSKMCPKVTDISFVGSLRITLAPLVDQIPGFVAAVVTFRKPPRVKYRLDFGKALGGKYVANVVKPFINYVIDNVLVNMLVWPQRLVIPIINTQEMQLEIAKLAYVNRGVLKVVVIKAEGLPDTDLIGSCDPCVELTTDGKYIAETTVKKSTASPTWNETFYLLVQEPTSQEMKVTVYDKDMFSAKELLTLNVGDAFGAKEFMCRTLVKLAPITAQEGEPATKSYHLGDGEWSNPEGCGKGLGKITLSCLYRSFQTFKADEVNTASVGIVTVRVVKAINMPRGGGGREAMTVYIKVKVGDESRITPAVTSKADHVFGSRNVFEFYGVKYSANIKLKAVEKTLVADDDIGAVELGVPDVAGSSDISALHGEKQPGLMLRTFKLDTVPTAAIVVQLGFIPYF